MSAQYRESDVPITTGASRYENLDNPAARWRGISVIFPAYNEEENIVTAIEHALDALSGLFKNLEIIVVNDGSRDNTRKHVEAMAAKHPEVVPVHHEGNRGYGAALRSGIENASRELIFFTDADLQFDINEIEHLVEWIDHYEIVAGYRARRADPLHRRLNAWGWKMLVRLVLRLKVRDIDCAFKLFRRAVFEDIELQSVGAMINTEILTTAQWRGMRIKEVPVSHYPRLAGEQSGANLKVILKAFRELVMMQGRLRKGQYKKQALPCNDFT